LTLAATVALAGTTAVALVSNTGGVDGRVDVRSETVPLATSSVVFVDLPGANTVGVVPAGTTRLFIARFAGESQCFGAGAAPVALCSLQIIATNTVTGATVAFDPAAGLDYAFDTNSLGAADDLWEGHAMERSKRLLPGTYRIRVQRAVTNPSTIFRLDDWHFSVETRA
jgi:hypothetical protein